jgi:hypothetical protein
MTSLCKVCNQNLSLNALNCTQCGDSDPFNKMAILDLMKQKKNSLIFTTIIPSVLVGIGAPLLAMAMHSWLVFIVGIGFLGYLHRDKFTDNTNYDPNLENLLRISFRNYLRANRDKKFEDDMVAQREYAKDMFDMSGGIYTVLHDTEEIFELEMKQ